MAYNRCADSGASSINYYRGKITMMNVDNLNSAMGLVEAATTNKRIKGLTHDFYRYPARFSPIFIRRVIEMFTDPGDQILDPFLGGGTTAVESRPLGRRSIGVDINSLATFVSKVKTTPLANKDTINIKDWVGRLREHLNLKNEAHFDEGWQDYYRNIDTKEAWPIRKTIQLALSNAENLSPKQKKFVRCCLLRTAQWAFDSRKEIPDIDHFRRQLEVNFKEMLDGIREYSKAAYIADATWNAETLPRTKILNRSAIGIENDFRISQFPAPKLVLTSPPYPGVHVLYHRWQVKGRRETPAPYWIAGTLDGSGASYYTFGDRKEESLESYFINAHKSFSSIAQLADKTTRIVQMIAFSDPSWQLPFYLDVLSEAGLEEVNFTSISNNSDGRLWRQVPNRKWFATHKGNTCGSKEVVLIHRLK